MIGESILEHYESNGTGESIKSYEYDDYQPITGTRLLVPASTQQLLAD